MTQKQTARKRILSLLLTLALIAGMVPISAMTVYAEEGGACEAEGCDGTYDNGFCQICDGYQPAYSEAYMFQNFGLKNTYGVANAGQLYWIAEKINSNENIEHNFYLLNDITVNPYVFDANGGINSGLREWVPIANATGIYAFDGTVYGNGHTISGLYVSADSAYEYVGLIGRASTPTIKDLRITNSYFEGTREYAGAFCGQSSAGKFENCCNEATVISNGIAGGIVGESSSDTYTRCGNAGTVKTKQDTSYTQCAGGIVGAAQAKLVTGNYATSQCVFEECFNTGTVTGTDTTDLYLYLGAIAGTTMFGKYMKCFYDSSKCGQVYGNAWENFSETGKMEPTIEDCEGKTEADFFNEIVCDQIGHRYFGGICILCPKTCEEHQFSNSACTVCGMGVIMVTGIQGEEEIPTSALEGNRYTLPTTVYPNNASYQTVVWNVKSGFAAINGSEVTFSNAGTIVLTATVKNGLRVGKNFTQDFTITVKSASKYDISEAGEYYDDRMTITESEGQLQIRFNRQTYQVAKGTPIEITGSKKGNYFGIDVQNATETVNLVLKDCSIITSESCPIDIKDAALNLTLQGSNHLETTSNVWPAIMTRNSASLEINGTGSLTAKAVETAAIGCGYNTAPGDITINGGTVTATGGTYAAGIGGGNYSSGGKLTINGGTVTATGGSEAAGIGGGSGKSGGTIIINGGTVNATGGTYAAGIGGGNKGKSGNITINGGTVTATGGTNAAGIGTGPGEGTVEFSNLDNIVITGGTVTAKGNHLGTGIGGGLRVYGGKIIITGGNIAASSGSANAVGKGGNTSSQNTTSVTDGKDNAISKVTYTLDGVSDVAEVTAITGCAYGLKDVTTLDTNRLYFYLPADSSVNTIAAGGETYICQKDNTFYTSHDWSNQDGICARCGTICTHPADHNFVCDTCGKNLHTHTWSYSKNGTTITAECQNTDEHCENPNGGSITLNAADACYTGKGIEATVSGKLTTGATYEITYDEGAMSAPSSIGTHSAKLTVGEGENAVTTDPTAYKISYLPKPENAYKITNGYQDSKGTYWFKGGDSITVSASDGYTIATVLGGTYDTTVTLSETDSKDIYLKNSNGEMTDTIAVTESISFDKTAPGGEIEITNKGIWPKIINKISFGWFFKGDAIAKVTANDTDSGVSAIAYYLADKDLIDDTELSDAEAISKLEVAVNKAWSTYSDKISLNSKAKNVIYVKMTDHVGNVSYINSEGIVLYADAEADTQTVTTTYKADSDQEVQVVLNGNTVRSVANGEKTLTADTDYTVTENVITLKGSYLAALNGGKYTFTVSYDPLGLTYAEAAGNDAPQTTSFQLVVERAEGSVSAISDVSKTYNGSAVSNPSYTSDSTGKATYEYKIRTAEDSTYTTAAPTAAGNYTVRVTVAADGNYKESSGTKDFTISNAALTDVSVTQSGTLPYTGSPQTASVQTKATAKGNQTVTFTYCDKKEGDYTESVPAFTEKGTYRVYYKASADNHEMYEGDFAVTISQAANEWTTTPDITGWSYGQEANVWTAVAKFGTVKVTYTGAANDGTAYNSTTAPENAGTYQAVFTVDATEDYTNLEKKVSFSIARAEQDAPSGFSHTDETIAGKADGTITGVDTAMEYRKDGETEYTAITGTTLENLTAVTCNIRYKEDANHNASPDTQVVISAVKKLKVTVPKIQTGYTLSADKAAFLWKEDVTFTFTLKDGYSKRSNFSVNVNGEPVTLDANGKYTVPSAEKDLAVTVEGIADITAPDAEIILGTNKWKEFFHNITFGLFFKDRQEVEITADDKGSGVDKISYYLSTTALTEEQVKALPSDAWTEYSAAFYLDPQKEAIIYAKVVDHDQNIKYISSDQGIVIDSIAPVISGIANGETYYGDTTFEVTDKYIDVVKVDGHPVTLTDGKYTMKADGKEHTVAAMDRSGNESAQIKITVITIASIDDAIAGITTDNAKSSDKQKIQDIFDLADRLIMSGKDFTDEENKELADIKENAKKLLEKIDETASASDPENVKTESGTQDQTNDATFISFVPASGDFSDLRIWMALVFVSSVFLGMAVYKRKRN